MMNLIDKYGDVICEIFIMLVIIFIPGTIIWILNMMLPILGIMGLIVLLCLCIIEAIMIETELERIIETIKEAREH